jgi:uncharacterized protein (DUF427 family)
VRHTMTTRMRDLEAGAFGDLRYEPLDRRVRADDVVDSTRAVLVWEPRRIVPSYAVPEADISAEVRPAPATDRSAAGVLHPGIPFAVHTARGTPVTVGGRVGSGFRLAEIGGVVVLDFTAFDAWLEEDERVFGHPRDPFKRIDVRRTSRPVRIEVDGTVLAESTHARMLFETGIHPRFYLPKTDVRGALVPSARRSYCPYKGEATYWSVGGHADIAWSYEHPLPDAPLVEGLVAFWDERVDVHLDGQLRGAPTSEIAEVMRDEFGLRATTAPEPGRRASTRLTST